MKFFPGILVAALLVASVQAQTPTPQPKSSPNPTPSPAAARHLSLKYKAPGNVASGTRHDVDAGSRGWNPKMPSIYVLAPNHTGFTTHSQPSLFWYQSGPSTTPIELTLIQVEPKKFKPILRVGAEVVDQPGIHRLSLGRYDVNLAPGVIYKWTVALVPNRANRSEDVIASDTIQRIEPNAQLASAIGSGKGLDKAATCASNGLWYDALECITSELDAAPKNRELRLERASLLEQAGLHPAAAYERR
jgi:hypothetical protein